MPFIFIYFAGREKGSFSCWKVEDVWLCPRLLCCSYISYNGMPVFNFAEHCSEKQTKPMGQTSIDYDDDPTQALILENTIHHTTEAEDFVRIKRGHPLNASVWLSDSARQTFFPCVTLPVYCL